MLWDNKTKKNKKIKLQIGITQWSNLIYFMMMLKRQHCREKSLRCAMSFLILVHYLSSLVNSRSLFTAWKRQELSWLNSQSSATQNPLFNQMICTRMSPFIPRYLWKCSYLNCFKPKELSKLKSETKNVLKHFMSLLCYLFTIFTMI